MIKTAQRLGFTLAEVADLVETGAHRRRRRDAGLQTRAVAKLAEVEQRIADLVVIRNTLRQALYAGCDDLTACSRTTCCPLPFPELAAQTARAGQTDQAPLVDS